MRNFFSVPSLALLVGFVASCGGGSSGETRTSLAPGTIADKPGAGGRFVADAHQGGVASDLRVVAVRWGRLVDLFDRDPATGARTPIFRDLVVDPNATGGTHHALERSPLTGAEELTILHPFGRPAFEAEFRRLEGGLQEVLDSGFGTAVLPPFTVLPRNAALVVSFDDLLDAARVNEATLRVLVGYPPAAPYQARVFPDPNHGGIAGGAFHSTRAVVDLTVGDLESQATGLPVNPIGLPAAVDRFQTNVELRLPTRVAPGAGQLEVLANLSQNPLSFAGSGSADPGSPTLDVVRAVRSGGPARITGDPYNGFLRDDTPPALVGVQTVQLTGVVSTGAASFDADLVFADPACALAPAPGDLVLLVSGEVARVEAASAPPLAGVAAGVSLRSLAGGVPAAGPGELRAAFRAGAVPECFVSVSPDPVGPNRWIDPAASIELAFSEPIDPDSFDAFDTVTLTDPAASGPYQGKVICDVTPELDGTEFALDPALPLRHAMGQSEVFRLDVAGGPEGVTDLAGNPLAAVPGPIALSVDPSAPTFDTGGLTLTFDAVDEDGDGAPELRGQAVYALGEGAIQSRAVSRFTREVNDSTAAAPTAQAMVPFMGRPDPMSPWGSKVQAVWRYHDLGMTLLDDAEHNVDVEGLYWVPSAGGVNINHFPEFQIALAHSKYLPDESVDPLTNGIFYPSSGMTTDYTGNLLDPVADPLTVVHQRHEGYMVQPVDAVLSAGGYVMAPYPLNLHVPPSQYRYWTWRDTAITAVGGPNGQGVDTKRLIDLVGGVTGYYPANAVPTIGLPLLMEFRAYPRSEILAESRVLYALANPVGIPFFRAWSTGFVDPLGVPRLVDPDNLPQAIGGIDDAQNPIPGTDIGVHYGQVDFVTRVSRAHTIWLDTGTASRFVDPVLRERLPSGTRVELAFRGAAGLNEISGSSRDARNYDPYGNPAAGFLVTYFNQDPGWKQSLAELDGARYVQVRISLVANAESGVVPKVDALGIPFYR